MKKLKAMLQYRAWFYFAGTVFAEAWKSYMKLWQR